MPQGATNPKDDPAPVVVGRVKKGSLRAIVEGLEREAVDRLIVRLLHRKTLDAAGEVWTGDPSKMTAEERREAVKTMLKAAIEAAEGLL